MTANDYYTLLHAAAGAAEAAGRVHGCLDEALAQLKAAEDEVDADTAIWLGQLASSIRQANDLTARFKGLYLTLPGSVATLKATAPNLSAAVKRLRKFNDDFQRTLDHQAAIEFQLSVAVKYFTDVLDPGHQVEPRRWRDLRQGAADNVATANSSMSALSQASGEVLRALRSYKKVKGLGML